MAKYRQIHMEMWGDPHFEAYTTDQKLIFIYLITNNLTRESGIYPISEKRISNDTGIGLPTVTKLLANGSIKNVYYDEAQNIVFIANFRKFNSGGRPELIQKAVEADFEKSPKSYLWNKFDELYPEFNLKEKLTVYKPLANPLQTGADLSSSIQDKSSQVNSIQDKLSNTCPESDLLTPEQQPLMEIPLSSKDQYFKVYLDYVDELKDTFSGVDVLQQLKEYRQWAYDYPTKRKTKNGIRRSISSWMSKKQDRCSGGNGNGPGPDTTDEGPSLLDLAIQRQEEEEAAEREGR